MLPQRPVLALTVIVLTTIGSITLARSARHQWSRAMCGTASHSANLVATGICGIPLRTQAGSSSTEEPGMEWAALVSPRMPLVRNRSLVQRFSAPAGATSRGLRVHGDSASVERAECLLARPELCKVPAVVSQTSIPLGDVPSRLLQPR